MGGSTSGRGKKRRTEPFIKVPKPLLKSAAWLGLPYSAQSVYLFLLMDICRAGQGELRLTYPQAAKLGVPAATLNRAFQELQAKGFIIKTKHGGLMERESVYVLSGEWRKSGRIK